jgi:hypothetical protein
MRRSLELRASGASTWVDKRVSAPQIDPKKKDARETCNPTLVNRLAGVIEDRQLHQVEVEGG